MIKQPAMYVKGTPKMGDKVPVYITTQDPGEKVSYNCDVSPKSHGVDSFTGQFGETKIIYLDPGYTYSFYFVYDAPNAGVIRQTNSCDVFNSIDVGYKGPMSPIP